MIIAINAISAKKGGMLTYTLSLIDCLNKLKSNDIFHIWVPLNLPRNSSKKVILHKTNATYYSPLKRLLYDQIILRNEIKKIKSDILFSSAGIGLIFSPCPQLLLIRNNVYYDRYYKNNIFPLLTTKEKISKMLHELLIFISAKRSDAIMFPSKNMKRSFLHHYTCKFKNTHINYYGISLDKYKIYSKKSRNYSDKTIRMIYVSKYYPHKKPDLLIKAYKLLKDMNYKVKTLITMKYDELETHLKEQKIDLSEVRENKDIIFKEIEHHKIPELLLKYDYFIFPSVCESFGFPLIEAMASEIPIIAADTDINREICGKAALYFQPNNTSELVKKILLIKNNIKIRNDLIKESTKRIDKYRTEKHVNKIINICKEMVS